MTSSRMFYYGTSRKHMLYVLLLTVTGISALKDVTVTIPQAASIGDTVTLQCRYDLEEEPLYTVKWYKGQREFFRFIPKELPSTQIFPFYGMEIDVSKSSKNAVVLRNIQQNITGKYICEVSTDAPNFYTISATGFMYVTHKPVGQPELVAERDALGYLLRGNCTSPSSYPAINLTWYLNGRQVNESFRIHIPDETTPTSDKRRPVMTMVGLEHVIEEDTYTAGNLLVVRCVANLFNLYQKDVQTVIHEEHPRPRPSSVLGTRGASSGSPTLGDLFVINAAILLAAIIR